MNKELYLKKEKLFETKRELYFFVSTLQRFITNYENSFKNKDSLDALERTKKYLTLKQELLKSLEKEYKEVSKTLRENCKHEILIKSSYDYTCPVCSSYFAQELPSSCVLAIDTKDDKNTQSDLERLFEEVVNSDKDLVNTFEETLEELQFDRNIKILRR